MMDAAVAGRDVALVHDEAKRAKTLRRFNLGDRTFKVITQISAVTVLALLAGVMLALLHGSLLTWQTFGLDFLFTEKWNPVTEKFGALAPIYGTLVTSTIAMLIGVPVSLGIAFFLTEISPERLRRPIGIAIELLAGIPSIIYGIWGLFVFAPWFQATVQPFLIDTFANIPLLNQLFAGPPYGIGMLTAGLILAIMVLPFITSITREVFDTVPPVLKEAAYGIGCTRWEVMRRVVIPYTRVGIIGGVMLGLGRALGETMAVVIILSASGVVTFNLVSQENPTPIAANIALQFPESSGVNVNALIASGLVLFAITLVVNVIARVIISRSDVQ